MSYKRKPQPIEMIYKNAVLCKSFNGKRGIYFPGNDEFIDMENYYISKLTIKGYSKFNIDQINNSVIVNIR